MFFQILICLKIKLAPMYFRGNKTYWKKTYPTKVHYSNFSPLLMVKMSFPLWGYTIPNILYLTTLH